jgi:hypothetical protein
MAYHFHFHLEMNLLSTCFIIIMREAPYWEELMNSLKKDFLSNFNKALIATKPSLYPKEYSSRRILLARMPTFALSTKRSVSFLLKSE